MTRTLHQLARQMVVLFRQAELGWGKSVGENLTRDLQTEFPERNGFSAKNLWAMRQFVNEYTAKPKLQPLIGEISWTQNLLIMARCKDDVVREPCELQNLKRRNLGSSHRRKEREREFRGLRADFTSADTHASYFLQTNRNSHLR